MKLFQLSLILIIIAQSAIAQIERKPVTGLKTDTAAVNMVEMKGDKNGRKDRMKELNLTKEQRVKLKEIREENISLKEAIENNEALSETEKKKKLRALQKDQAQKIQAVLTPEQREKFKTGKQNNP